MHIPQILYVVIGVADVTLAYLNRGKPIKHAPLRSYVALMLMSILLYWGGFFGEYPFDTETLNR